jgi:Thioredoxin
MALAWAALAEDWKNHSIGLIAEVDCSEEVDLCEEYAVQDYPTLLYGDPVVPDRYEGRRTYRELSDFAKGHISQVICTIHNISACDWEQKRTIEELEAKPRAELEFIDALVEGGLNNTHVWYDQRFEQLTRKSAELKANYTEKVKAIHTSYSRWVEQILLTR